MTSPTLVAEQILVGNATVTPWEEARERLENPEQGRTYWLATVRPDGRPHVVPLLGLWLDDAFYFLTGEMTRRGKNLADNSRCVMAVSSQMLPALELVVEGDCRKVSALATLQRVAKAYQETMV